MLVGSRRGISRRCTPHCAFFIGPWRSGVLKPSCRRAPPDVAPRGTCSGATAGKSHGALKIEKCCPAEFWVVAAHDFADAAPCIGFRASATSSRYRCCARARLHNQGSTRYVCCNILMTTCLFVVTTSSGVGTAACVRGNPGAYKRYGLHLDGKHSDQVGSATDAVILSTMRIDLVQHGRPGCECVSYKSQQAMEAPWRLLLPKIRVFQLAKNLQMYPSAAHTIAKKLTARMMFRK